MKKLLFSFYLIFPFLLVGQDLSQGIIGHWPLDGNGTDLSVNANSGTVAGAIPAEDRFGESGGSLFFNGGSYIEFGDVMRIGTGDFSMSAWVKLDNVANETWAIASKSIPHNGSGRYGFGISDNRIRAFFDLGPDVNFQGNTFIPKDTWHLVTATYDRDDQLKIYLDGVLDGARDISSADGMDFQRPDPFSIGEYVRGTWGFKGALDDVRFYNRVLSQQEVTMLFEEGTEEERTTYQEPVFSNENYVYTRTPRVAVSSSNDIEYTDQVMESVNYFDGLGRPRQAISMRGGGNEEDLVTPVVYDDFGRQVLDYLPFADASLSGEMHQNAVNSVESFYNVPKYDHTLNPYSEKDLEASPLNRLRKQAAPGEDWKLGNDHEIEFDYGTNVLEEVRMFRVIFNNADTEDPALEMAPEEFYSPGQLYKTITRDENHTGTTKNHTTEEFKDKQGRVVLKRTYADVGSETEVPHDTYYIYDDYGNLTYVLPPKRDAGEKTLVEIQTDLDKLGYQYRYDSRNRVVEKKIPGKGWEHIVYNRLDQPVMTQDAVQRLKSPREWLFTKYDAFGRVAYTGYIKKDDSRTSLQATMDSGSHQYEKRGSNSIIVSNADVFYSNNGAPQNMEEVYTINYYHSYDDIDIGFAIPDTTSFGDTLVKGAGTKGLATVTKIKVLGTSYWNSTAMGYDSKGRLIWSKIRNVYLGTIDVVEHQLDFTGNVLETKSTHQKTGMPTIVTDDYFEYDHVNRLTLHSQSVNGSSREVIAENIYDELGQLVGKGVGNTGTSRLQDITYSYNIRGWLTGINDVSTTSNLFNFKLSYNDPVSGTPIFNGNISQAEWRTENIDNSLKTYTYSYDALNRITSAIDNTGNYTLSGLSYDMNGNILSLQREGHLDANVTLFGNMDDLTYTYDAGNQLMRVSDIGNNTEGFKDDEQAAGVEDASDDYFYDANGNLTSDVNKGIQTDGIEYNHLNLPTSITLPGGTISYTYDATGMKLQKKIVESGQLNKYTFYAGNFIYGRSGDSGTGTMEFFNHPEGYVSYDGGQFHYVYNYKDHLGNVRLSYADLDGNGSINASTEILDEKNYYPFGGEHAGYNTLVKGTYHPYGFNGKEEQDEHELQWMDFGARNYDKWLGRWMNVDPLAEAMPSHSPYNYAFNNPLRFTDPTGLAPEDWVLGKDGKYTWDANVTSANDADLGGREYIGKSTNDVAVHYAENNPVSNFFGGSPEFGDTSTWPGEITPHENTMVDNWADGNLVQRAVYETTNSFSIVGQSMNPFDNQVTELRGSDVGNMDNSGHGANVAATLLPIGSAKIAAGPTKQWLRIGSSFSKNLKSQGLNGNISTSIRWGASPAQNGKYLKEIPSTTFRGVNQWLRKQKLPGNSWRVKDAGHFHIKK